MDRNLLNNLYRYGYALTNNREDAFDLLHTSIAKILRRHEKSELDTFPKAFFKTVMRNEWIDRYRRSQREPLSGEALGDNVIDLAQDPLDAMTIRQEEVTELLGQLNAEERELLYLHAVEEYTIAEIATLWDMPRGTLLSRMHRLRRRILASQKQRSRK